MKRQDLPLDLVVLADLGIAAGHAALGRIHRLEPDGFAAFMASLAPAVTLGTTRLAFDDPRGFRPEAVATRAPETAALLSLRERVSKQGIGARELEAAIAALPQGSALRQALQSAAGRGPAPAATATPAPPPPPPPAPVTPPRLTPASTSPEGNGIDALFDLVDVAGSAAPADEPAPRASATSTRALDRLVSLLGASGADRASSATQASLARVIDETLGETLRALLHDPGFLSLEQTWTGLRFLVRRVDFRSGVRLHVLPVTRATLARDAREVLERFAEDQRRDARVTVALVDFDLAGDDAGLALAAALAAVGAETQTPIVAGLDPARLGIASLAAIESIENVDDLLATDAQAAWNALRAADDARWLALVANRFLLRLPYGAEHDRVKGFAFDENPEAGEPAYLWGRGPWAIGERIAASYGRCGWGVQLTGQDEDVMLADLPVRLMRLKTGAIVPAPLEAMLSERRALEFAQGGIVALLCRRGGDAAFLAGAPMAHRPPGAGTPRSTTEARRDTLPFAMMVAQVGAWVAHLDNAGRFPTEAERTTALARGIEFLSMNEEGATLEASVEGDAIRVTPYREPLRGLPDFAITRRENA